MNVSLTPQLEALVNSKVQSGRYGSASEVVRDALRLLDERDQLQAAKLAQLKADVAEGVEQIKNKQGRYYDKSSLKELASQIAARGRRKAGSQ